MASTDWEWKARRAMADRGFNKTSDLLPPLRARGFDISREQVYRIVTVPPRRINVDILVALCDILDCGLEDIIERDPQALLALGERRARVSPSPGTEAPERQLPYPLTVPRPE